MSRLLFVFKFVKHWIRARRWDSFHSPYLFRLFTYCCHEKNSSPWFDRIEGAREKLTNSKDTISLQDYGAGSSMPLNQNKATVSRIARHALSAPFQCRFLYRLAIHEKPTVILEFGTSLGISTAYLASAAPNSRLITVEGDIAIARKAESLFENFEFHHIDLRLMTFEVFLSNNDEFKSKIDLFFLDGNHRSEALLEYYHRLKHLFHTGSIVVVDDIYWSEDMQRGWQELIRQPEVAQSVDCFFFGMLFFNPDFMDKKNHLIRLPLSMVLD